MSDDTQRISLCPATCQETVIGLKVRVEDLEERAEKQDTQIETIKSDVNDMKVSAGEIGAIVQRIETKIGGISKGIWSLVLVALTIIGTWALGKF